MFQKQLCLLLLGIFISNHSSLSKTLDIVKSKTTTIQDTTLYSDNVNIKGVILDGKTREPIPYCNIFIVNTLNGTTTDESGFFEIKNIQPGHVQIMASFVGYEPTKKTLNLEAGINLELQITMLASNTQLAEVEVNSTKDSKWQAQFNRFEKGFFGESINARESKILNPWVLEFEENKRTLSAAASEPLVIENNALGYKITYYLNEFRTKGKAPASYLGETKFEHLEPKNKKEAEKWINNRNEAYNGSLRQFLWALAHNNLEEEGFIAYQEAGLMNEFKLLPIDVSKVVHNTSSPHDKEIVFEKQVEIRYTKKWDANGKNPVSFIKANAPFIININGWLYDPFAVEISGAMLQKGTADILPYGYIPENGTSGVNYPFVKNKLEERFNDVSSQLPNQHLYLHFDKPHYASGDDIWFNSYLTHYNSKKLIPGINKIHVDFISPADTIIKSLIIPAFEGTGSGVFTIPEDAITDNYTIRAYTSGMLEYDKNLFYEKQILINNTGDTHKVVENTASSETEFDLQFLPEGGNMIYGLNGSIAFKAVNSSGMAKVVEGVVLDDKDKVVASFKSNQFGLGSFYFKPEFERTYKAKVISEKTSKIFTFPQALNEGYSLSVDNEDPDIIRVTIRSSSTDSQEGYQIIGQSRNIIYYQTSGNYENSSATVEIPKADLPEGVLQLTLFDGNSLPQSERLVYISQGLNNLKVDAQPQKLFYGKREKVEIDLKITDEFDNPIEGIASLSVLNADYILANRNQENIVTNLLLSADLKGYIEDPYSYFKDQTPETLKDLDLLMLTHGWRRFNWKEILDQDLNLPKPPNENEGLTVTGTVYHGKKPLPNAQLVLLPPAGTWNPYISIDADENGKFRIPDVEVLDTTKVVFKVMNAKERVVDARIEFDKFPSPALVYLPKEKPVLHDSLLYKFLSRSELIHGMEGATVLEEVVIKKSRIKKDPEREGAMIPFTPSHIIKNEVGRFTGYKNILEAIQYRLPERVPTGGDNNKGYLQDDFYFILDGTPVSRAALESVPGEMVDRVEYLKRGPGTIIVGDYKSIIAVYSKKDFDGLISKEVKIHKLPSYSPIKEFYAPKYENKELNFDQPDYRTTLYWNPEIEIDVNGKANISFYNSDDATQFQLILQGISYEGQPFVKVMTFGRQQ